MNPDIASVAGPPAATPAPSVAGSSSFAPGAAWVQSITPALAHRHIAAPLIVLTALQQHSCPRYSANAHQWHETPWSRSHYGPIGPSWQNLMLGGPGKLGLGIPKQKNGRRPDRTTNGGLAEETVRVAYQCLLLLGVTTPGVQMYAIHGPASRGHGVGSATTVIELNDLRLDPNDAALLRRIRHTLPLVWRGLSRVRLRGEAALAMTQQEAEWQAADLAATAIRNLPVSLFGSVDRREALIQWSRLGERLGDRTLHEGDFPGADMWFRQGAHPIAAAQLWETGEAPDVIAPLPYTSPSVVPLTSDEIARMSAAATPHATGHVPLGTPTTPPDTPTIPAEEETMPRTSPAAATRARPHAAEPDMDALFDVPAPAATPKQARPKATRPTKPVKVREPWEETAEQVKAIWLANDCPQRHGVNVHSGRFVRALGELLRNQPHLTCDQVITALEQDCQPGSYGASRGRSPHTLGELETAISRAARRTGPGTSTRQRFDALAAGAASHHSSIPTADEFGMLQAGRSAGEVAGALDWVASIRATGRSQRLPAEQIDQQIAAMLREQYQYPWNPTPSYATVAGAA